MKTVFNYKVLGLFSMLLLCSTILTAQQDAITRFFGEYSENDKFSVVYISPAMFDLFTDVEAKGEDQDMVDVIKSLKGLRILTTDHGSANLYKEAMSKIPTSEYDVLMEVRDNDGSNVKFLTKRNGQMISELLLLAGGGSEDFVLMSFVGDLDLKKISKLSKSLNVEGAEHLEKIENQR